MGELADLLNAAVQFTIAGQKLKFRRVPLSDLVQIHMDEIGESADDMTHMEILSSAKERMQEGRGLTFSLMAKFLKAGSAEDIDDADAAALVRADMTKSTDAVLWIMGSEKKSAASSRLAKGKKKRK